MKKNEGEKKKILSLLPYLAQFTKQKAPIHSFAMKHKIDLLEHGSQCPLCKEDNFSFFKFWKNIL